MGIENEDDILEISDLLKKFTPAQKKVESKILPSIN